MKRYFPKNDDAPLLTKYHDHEWGKLNLNEHYLYEMMVLESLPVINVSNYWKTEESFVISEKLMPPLIMPV